MASVTVIEAASSSTTIKYTLKSLHFKSNSKLNTTSILPHFISKHKSLQLLFRSKLTPHFQPLVTSSSKRDDDVIYSHAFGAKTINRLHFRSKIASSSSKSDIIESLGEGEVDGNGDGEIEGVEVEIEKVGRNRRRIRSKVAIDATLETVWGILTDYERLADYIPGLVVSQVLDKQTNFARLLQVPP
ncbi:START-like domain-containing protein [Tanacetum coccineum]